MAALCKIKPRLQTLDTSRVKTLHGKAGTTPRERGGSWTAKRKQIALIHECRCADCGCAWQSDRDEIDHEIPLEQGGSNDDSNLRPRCRECHKAKSRREAEQRAGKG